MQEFQFFADASTELYRDPRCFQRLPQTCTVVSASPEASRRLVLKSQLIQNWTIISVQYWRILNIP